MATLETNIMTTTMYRNYQHILRICRPLVKSRVVKPPWIYIVHRAQLFNLQDEMLKDSDCSSRSEFTTQHALHVDLFPEAFGGNVGGSEDTSSSSSRSSSNSTFSPLQACFGDNSLKRTYHINGAYYFTKAYIYSYINIYSLYPTCVLSFWLIFYEIDYCNLLLRTTARNSIIIL